MIKYKIKLYPICDTYMEVESGSSGDSKRLQQPGQGLIFSYPDGVGLVKTSVEWVPNLRSYKITDQALNQGVVRETYKTDIDGPPSIIRVELKENPVINVKHDNSNGKDDFRATIPRSDNFRNVTARYDINGAVIEGFLQIADNDTRFFRSFAGELESVRNEFDGGTLEDNVLELFRRAVVYPDILSSYAYVSPNKETAKQALMQDVRRKTVYWDNASKQRAFPGLNMLANEAAIQLLPKNVPLEAKKEAAFTLALHSVLSLPDSFPTLSVHAQENPELYEDIFHRTVKDLLQLHTNYTRLGEIYERSFHTFGYEIDQHDSTKVKVTFSQASDPEYREKSKEGRLSLGEELIWDGTVYRIDRTPQGELTVAIVPIGGKQPGREFRYPVINRAVIIDGLGSSDDLDWLVVRQVMPEFTPIPPKALQLAA